MANVSLKEILSSEEMMRMILEDDIKSGQTRNYLRDMIKNYVPQQNTEYVLDLDAGELEDLIIDKISLIKLKKFIKDGWDEDEGYDFILENIGKGKSYAEPEMRQTLKGDGFNLIFDYSGMDEAFVSMETPDDYDGYDLHINFDLYDHYKMNQKGLRKLIKDMKREFNAEDSYDWPTKEQQQQAIEMVQKQMGKFAGASLKKAIQLILN